jgi:hypothetical protein
MVKLENASLYGTPFINVNPTLVTSITQENTEPPCCTIRIGKVSGHFRVVGDFDQVCALLGLNKQEMLPKEI